MRFLYGWSIALTFLLLAACGRDGMAWSESRSFPGSKWEINEKLTFSPDTMFLTGEKVRAVVSLRYAEDASAVSFPLVVETENPGEGLYRCDTVIMRLLKAEERIASRGKLGVFETVDTLQIDSSPAPGWTVTLYPAAKEEITGLYSITFDLEKFR